MLPEIKFQKEKAISWHEPSQIQADIKYDIK